MNAVWVITPKEGTPLVFALCRKHGRRLRSLEPQYVEAGCRVDVVRNSLALVRLRREAGGSRHLRECIECGRQSGILATYVEGPLGLEELLRSEASA